MQCRISVHQSAASNLVDVLCMFRSTVQLLYARFSVGAPITFLYMAIKTC